MDYKKKNLQLKELYLFLKMKDIAIYESVMSQFRSGHSMPKIQYEALNAFICLIKNADIDENGTLMKICKELMELIYEVLTDLRDD